MVPHTPSETRIVVGWDLVQIGGELHLVGRDWCNGNPEVSAPIVDMHGERLPAWVVAEDGQRYSLFQHGIRSPKVLQALQRVLQEWGVPERVRKQVAVIRYRGR